MQQLVFGVGGYDESKQNNNILNDSSTEINLQNQRLISVEDFRNLFTNEQLYKIAELQFTDANVRLLLLKLSTRQSMIDLDAQSIRDGLDYLLSIEVLNDLSMF